MSTVEWGDVMEYKGLEVVNWNKNLKGQIKGGGEGYVE